MKIISWNVNGIRSVFRKGFGRIVKKLDPDIILLQEIKADINVLKSSRLNLSGYKALWNPSKKKGYAGTGIYTRRRPLKIIKSIGDKKFDDEGRLLILEFEKFYFINIYLPHSGRNLQNLDKKLKFNKLLAQYSKYLQSKKPLIIGGDFNVAHREIDLANPKTNIGNAGFTSEEKSWFSKYLNIGFIDTFRQFNKNSGNYTWWLQAFEARKRNIGWRIDYILLDKKTKSKLLNASILPQIMGSDHCPIEINLRS